MNAANLPATMDPAERTRQLVDAGRDDGDPTAWFERVYAEAGEGRAIVPWAGGGPEPVLVEWTEAQALDGAGRRALVVGSGLGDDAEHVAALGFETVAFDVAPSALEAARRRFPGSPVDYLTADLLDPPAAWRQAFDLVVESFTVQALPDPPRGDAIARVAELVAPGGTLVVIASARAEDSDPPHGPPWPLTRTEVEAFATGGVELVRVETLPSGLWRAELRRLR